MGCLRRSLFALGAGLALTAFGCAAEDDGGFTPPDKLRDDIPDPPPGGVQIVTPSFEIAPGEEVFMCMRVPFEVTEDWYVQDSAVYQMNNGHHTLLYFAATPPVGVDPEPHPCDGLDMTDVRIVTTGAADGAGMSMPDGVVLQVPAGAELWAQSHYINATDQTRTVQDVINIELVPLDAVDEIAGTFAHVDLTFAVPPGERYTRSMECEIQQAMNVPWLLPHMHEWGEEITIEVERDGEMLWDLTTDWAQNLRNDFPIEDLNKHLELQAGDLLRTTCTWNNTEAASLQFPQEMCVTFFPFYPGDGGLLACDETGATFTP